jgi:hypothetical protein
VVTRQAVLAGELQLSATAASLAGVRPRVPVGMVNPGSGFAAGHLSGKPGAGVGGQWWRALQALCSCGRALLVHASSPLTHRKSISAGQHACDRQRFEPRTRG